MSHHVGIVFSSVTQLFLGVKMRAWIARVKMTKTGDWFVSVTAKLFHSEIWKTTWLALQNTFSFNDKKIDR